MSILRLIASAGGFLCALGAFGAVVFYEGFPNSGGAVSATEYGHALALNNSSNRQVVNASHVGFDVTNTWTTGTGTIRTYNVSLSYTDPAGSPQAGCAFTSYFQQRGISRGLATQLTATQAQRGIYMSALVRWNHQEMFDTVVGYSSLSIDGNVDGEFGNQYGAFVGFKNTGATSGDPRDLIVRYRTGSGTYTDQVLVSGIAMGTDYFVVVKMVQAASGPDKIFAQAYSAGSYPVEAPASWAIGGSDGLDAECLAEGSGDRIDRLNIWGQGNGSTTVPGNQGGGVDEAILGEYWQDVVPASADSSDPTILSELPADDTSNATMTRLVLSFSEPVLLGAAGSITIDHLAGGTDIVYDVATAGEQLEVFHNQLTIHPDPGLVSGEPYAIQIDAGALVDEQGNSFAGIADTSTWNFDLRLLIYDGFNVPDAYSHATSVDGIGPVHSSSIAILAGNRWGETGGATSTIRGWNVGLAYTDPSGSPQPGSLATVYRNDRGMGRTPGVKVGQAQAEAGIYMSGLIRWVSNELVDGMAGFSSEQINGGETPNFNSKYGAYVGFVDPAPPSAARDLVVRYRNPAGVSTDSIIIPNITMGSDYFVVVKMVQGNGADDRIFAEAYSAGSYPTQAPVSWTVGGTTGIAANCLAEGGAEGNDIDTMQIWGGATTLGGDNNCVSGGCQPGGLYDELYLGEVWQDVVPASADSAAPIIASLTPADNELAADYSSDLIITFDEPVFLGTGNITVLETNSGDSTVIDVTSHGGQLALFHNQLTISPSGGLELGGDYAVLIDATAIDDEHGNSFAGIADSGIWNFATKLLIYDGFPTGVASGYTHNQSFDLAANRTVVHPSHQGFTASNTWSGGTSTIRPRSTESLAFSDPAGAPQPGSAAILFQDQKGRARDFTGTISKGRAEAGLYMSGLVRWTQYGSNDLLNAFASFTDAEMDNTDPYVPQNQHGVFFGFAEDGANRDLIIRYRTSAGTFADQLLVDNITPGTDYFVIVKMMQGDGGPDLAFANAYSAGNYPSQPPTAWTVGGASGVSGEFLDQGGANPIRFLQMWGGDGPNLWVNNDGSPNSPGANFDELTLGSRWADVVPSAADSTAPSIVVSSFDPADGSTGVNTGVNLVCNFDEDILLGAGNITLKNLSGGSDIVIDVAAHASQLTVKGTQLTIDLSGVMDGSTDYAVQFAAGSITDIASNALPAIVDTTTWNFQTAIPDIIPPVISALNPADNEPAAPLATTISVTFNEDIQAGSGNLEIRDLGDGSDTRIIPVTDLQVSIAGAVLTITPNTAFEHSEDYSVRIAATAVEDISGNAFAGIANDTSWNFTTLTPDVKIATGTFITPGALGPFAVTGVGFQPKALMVWTTGASGSAAEANAFFCQGFTDGTTNVHTATASLNDTVNLVRRQDIDDLLVIFDTPGTTLDVLARLASFDADGFTLNFSAQAAGHLVHYVAFGGADLTASVAQVSVSAGSHNFGFRPDLCFITNTGQQSGTRQEESQCLISLGAFDRNLNQWMCAAYGGTEPADHIKDSILATDRFSSQFFRFSGGSYTWSTQVSSVTDTGFTWTTAGVHGGDVMFVLGLNFGGLDAVVGDFTKEVSGVDGVSQSLPDLGFMPLAYGLTSACEVDEVVNSANDLRITQGVVAGANQNSATTTGEDSAVNEHARSRIGSLLGIATVGATIQAEAYARTIKSSTPSIRWSPNNTSPYIIGYWAIESTANPPVSTVFRFR